ncbi:P-loop ATPase, Sll1717 family [Micromonospora chalcea]
MEEIFFGYSARPSILSETMRSAAATLNDGSSTMRAVSWEDLVVDGRLIINEVEAAIEQCTLGLFELSTLSENVLFELGLSIGKRKRVGILVDSQDARANRSLRDLALLATTGITSYRNAVDLVDKVSRIASLSTLPLWDDLTGGVPLPPVDQSKIFYMPSFKEDDASQRLSRVLDSYDRFEVATVDMDEYGGSPLAWFAEQIYTSASAVFHMTPERAILSETSNARASLLAGMARGLGRDIIIIMEDSAVPAIDYRDLAIHYRNAVDLEKQAIVWMETLRAATPLAASRVRRHISVELSALRFGNHVAESDQEGLDQYFVETRDFRDVVDAAATIFTGKKGTGKTANMLQAAELLKADARNLVCVIKPASYELEALLDVLRRISSRHLGDYLIEGLWKYLIYTEVAARAVEEAEKRPAGISSGSAMDQLRAHLEEQHRGVEASFSIRLDMLVRSLELALNEGIDESQVEAARQRVNTALYSNTLRNLRSLLGAALSDRNRIAVLVDNLDKAWQRGADLELLSRLLLGLLTVVGRIVDEFKRDSPKKLALNVTLTAFLRSDIYAYVREYAREPDKISTAEIEWRDTDLLARVLEDRFMASKPNVTAEDLWEHAFVPQVKNMPTREYLLSRVQPRPRDLVFFANAALLRASNAKHEQVEEKDLLEAEAEYSSFAFLALLVEGVAAKIDLERVLYEFAGEKSIITEARLGRILKEVKDLGSKEYLISTLRRLGFLGIETSDKYFDFGGTEGEMRRANVLSKKLTKAYRKPQRYQIHPAYRAYLEIEE